MPTITRFQGTGGIRPDVKQKQLPTQGAGAVETAVAGIGAAGADFTTRLLAERKKIQSINYTNQRTELKDRRYADFNRQAQVEMDPETGTMGDGRLYTDHVEGFLKEEDSLHSEDAPTGQAKQMLRQNADKANRINLLNADSFQHQTIVRTSDIKDAESMDEMGKRLLDHSPGDELTLVDRTMDTFNRFADRVNAKNGVIDNDNKTFKKLEVAGQNFSKNAMDLMVARKDYRSMEQVLSHYIHTSPEAMTIAEEEEVADALNNLRGKDIVAGNKTEGQKQSINFTSLQVVGKTTKPKQPHELEKLMNNDQKNAYVRKLYQGLKDKSKEDLRGTRKSVQAFKETTLSGDLDPHSTQTEERQNVIADDVLNSGMSPSEKGDAIYDMASHRTLGRILDRTKFSSPAERAKVMDSFNQAIGTLHNSMNDPRLSSYVNNAEIIAKKQKDVKSIALSTFAERGKKLATDGPQYMIDQGDERSNLLFRNILNGAATPEEFSDFMNHVEGKQINMGQSPNNIRHLPKSYLQAEASVLKNDLESSRGKSGALKTISRWRRTFGKNTDAVLENMVTNGYLERSHVLASKIPNGDVRERILDNGTSENRKALTVELNKPGTSKAINEKIDSLFGEVRSALLPGNDLKSLKYVQDLEDIVRYDSVRLATVDGVDDSAQKSFDQVINNNYHILSSGLLPKVTAEQHKLTGEKAQQLIDDNNDWKEEDVVDLNRTPVLKKHLLEERKLSEKEAQEVIKDMYIMRAKADDTGITRGIETLTGEWMPIPLKKGNSKIKWSDHGEHPTNFVERRIIK